MKQFNTLKITVLLLVFSSTQVLKAQIPFDGKTAIMGGFAHRSGSQTGMYYQTKPGSSSFEFDFAPKDKGTGKSIDARFMRFSDDRFEEASFDAFLYLSASILGLKSANPEADNFYGNAFLNNDLNDKYYTRPNISKHSHMVSNYKIVEYMNNKAYKSGLMLGARIDWRTVGILSTGFTWFDYQNYRLQNSSSMISKFCLGVDVGFRKNIGKFTSVTILAFDRNILNGKTISVTANPSIKSTLFFGKNMGFYTTLKYEYQKGFSGGAGRPKVPYELSIFEFKIGAYLTSLKEI